MAPGGLSLLELLVIPWDAFSYKEQKMDSQRLKQRKH